MAGGDSHVIINQGVGGMGALNSLHVVDASSVRAGNMTESRNVTDRTGKTQELFFTAQGAALYDQYSDPNNTVRPGGPGITVEKDPSGISRLWSGIVKTEEGVGTP